MSKNILLPLLTLLTILGATIMFSFLLPKRSLDYYTGTTPQVDFETYFNGPIKAWGIIQDWRGRIITRFDVEMVGVWNGDSGTLTENFTYYDGTTQKRIWTIKKLTDNTYEGTAPDIIGKATGGINGSAVQWKYTMDVPVGESTYRIKFDDWMWMMNDGVLINRSYLTKFGITVSELTLFMQKQS